MPDISLTDKFDHEKYAESLVDVCPGKVFKIKKNKAVVVDPRSCTTCRECLKLDGVEVAKISDHFICKYYLIEVTVETTGVLTP